MFTYSRWKWYILSPLQMRCQLLLGPMKDNTTIFASLNHWPDGGQTTLQSQGLCKSGLLLQPASQSIFSLQPALLDTWCPCPNKRKIDSFPMHVNTEWRKEHARRECFHRQTWRSSIVNEEQRWRVKFFVSFVKDNSFPILSKVSPSLFVHLAYFSHFFLCRPVAHEQLPW